MNIPDGYHSVTPWIIGKNTAGVIDFLIAAFDAADLGRMADEDGNIGHAEVRIGDSVVMLFDSPQRPAQNWPATPAFLRMYVDDIHATIKKAVAAGATIITEPMHLFWGDLVGRFSDPFGNLYWVQTRIEVLDEQEMMRRMTDPEFTKAMDYVTSSLFVPETR